ncbi:hypothetical protein Plhal703r1_c31g0121401 [Plasmopara halstedii]
MLIAGSILFLVCSTSAYNSTRSTSSYQTAAGVPVDGVLIANSSSSVLNLSSSHETRNKDVEERGIGGLFGKMFDTITDLVKGPVPAEYTFYVTSLNKYEDLDAVLTSPEMESLYNFCKKYNDKHKNKLLSVAPVLERFKDKAINNKLHDLAMIADGKQPMMKHLALQHRDNLLMKKKQSPMEFFALLEFGDDLTEAIRNGKFDELLGYIVLHNYNNTTNKLNTIGTYLRQIYEVKHRLGQNAVDIVDPLKASLFDHWNEKRFVFSVWGRLQFGPDDALTSGKLEIFHEYIAKIFPSIKPLVLEEFTRTYGENGVTEALANAMILPHTKVFASTMYHERLNYWDTHAYSMKRVFDLLKFSKIDSANTALFKLETFSDFICSIKKNDRLASKLSVADLQNELFEVWTNGRIPPEKLLSKLSAPIDTNGNVNAGVNPAEFDRDVSSFPFDDPRRS